MTANQRSGLIRRNADFIEVLEAAYAPEKDDQVWLGRIIEATERAFQHFSAIGIQVNAHEDNGANVRPLMGQLATTLPIGAGILDARLGSMPATTFRALYYPKVLAMTLSEIEDRLDPETLSAIRSLHLALNTKDAFGIMAHPEPGVAATLWGVLPERHTPSHHERRSLSRVALHLECALRLRRRPETVVAVLSSDGKLLHREEEAPSTETLAFQTKTIERSRLRRARTNPDAVALWHALVDGSVSLVERESHGVRHYLVLENAPASKKHRLLSQQETNVIALAARDSRASSSPMRSVYQPRPYRTSSGTLRRSSASQRPPPCCAWRHD